MNWGEVLIQVFLTFVATGLGAGVAFAVERWTRRRDPRATEYAELGFLTDDLANRRSLSPPDPRSLDGFDATDLEQVIASIFKVRDSISETRRALVPDSPNLQPLRGMTAACNRFLHRSHHEPHRYRYALTELITDLDQHRQELSISSPPVGSLAYSAH